jgi:hypothetical protein
MKDVPLILAVHDFCADNSMVWSAPALGDYLYGVRHSWKKSADGKLEITETRSQSMSGKLSAFPPGFLLLQG